MKAEETITETFALSLSQLMELTLHQLLFAT
jgi:hypothetical protein